MKHAFFLLLAGVLLPFLQALPWHLLSPEMATINLSFVIVVMAGFQGNNPGSWILAVLLGSVLESLSGSPKGLISIINLFTLFTIRVLARFILFERLLSQALILFFFCSAAEMALPSLAGMSAHHSLNRLLAEAVLRGGITTILSVPLLLFYNKTVRVPER